MNTEIVVKIVNGVKLFTHLPHVCAQCLLYQLTQHTLYSTNEHYIRIVDMFKDAETMEQIHHIIDVLAEWGEQNHVVFHITL